MKVEIPPGKYVLAVSGGVDSMVLLDILRQNPAIELVVAHFNHGIREDSVEDEKLVVSKAKEYGLSIEVGKGKMGRNTSEENARDKRYEFLNNVKEKYQADKIVAAHHQDDLIETAFINILRGSGHRGLAAMKINPEVLRPLISIKKQQLVDYAKSNGIIWREDSTNNNELYLRNYLRKNIMPKLNVNDYEDTVKNIDFVAKNTKEKDQLLAKISQKIVKNKLILRSKYIMLPRDVRYELIIYWLRQQGIKEYNRKIIEKVDITLKTALAGTKHPVKQGLCIKVDIKTAQFDTRD
jgi:tRNA(Ile)-lysidine synthetase-like protein